MLRTVLQKAKRNKAARGTNADITVPWHAPCVHKAFRFIILERREGSDQQEDFEMSEGVEWSAIKHLCCAGSKRTSVDVKHQIR